MKWFKHETSAHKGSILQELYAEFGVNEGYALYFRLIEYLGHKWDGIGAPSFRILTSELRQYLKLTTRRLRHFATIMELSDNSSFKVTDKFCDIYLPKLLEVRHRDALNAGARQASLQHESGGDKKRVIHKEKEDTSAPASDSQKFENRFKFDFQSLFAKYPRFEKKTESIGLLLEHVQTQADYDEVTLAISAYRARCEREGTERQFMLTFPNFWKEWRDWLDPQMSKSDMPDLSHLPWEKPEGA